ncbi:dethiobiotin synthase [Paraflavisolibacter sp. H34]|uniref:dethiobiotin synthase n=1 Tax=Huijunlia imazamoxiresistens TaxID=3127457 RepID=UPI00301B0A92
MNLLIAGIHTGTGKTVCSAVMAEALQYDYWKPVQAGDLEASDSIFVRRHVANAQTRIHPEGFRLQRAASPHWAAEEEGREITLDALALALPRTDNALLVETAGGVMTPLSRKLLNLDLVRHLGLPVVLVADNYLGSINHTLLTLAALRGAGADIVGIVFSGEEVPPTREYILMASGLPLLFSIPRLDRLTPEVISAFAHTIQDGLKQQLDEHSRKR